MKRNIFQFPLVRILLICVFLMVFYLIIQQPDMLIHLLEASNKTGNEEQTRYLPYKVFFTNPDEEYKPGAEVIEELVELIDTAQHTLDIAIYQLDLDKIEESLLSAAARGVAVRIVTDDDSIYSCPAFIELADAGIPVVHDDSPAIMHHKFVIMDGETLWTGSWNFTQNDTYHNNNNAILIRSAELSARYQNEFDEMFIDHLFGSQSPPADTSPALLVGQTKIETCFSPDEQCEEQIVEQLMNAQQSIRFMTFSLTHEKIGTTIIDRANSGLDVKGIVDGQMANITGSFYPAMQSSGISVLVDGNPDFLHHKVIIIDETITILGSYNFSQNGSRRNDENLLIIEDQQLANSFLAEFEKNWNQALSMREEKPSSSAFTHRYPD